MYKKTAFYGSLRNNHWTVFSAINNIVCSLLWKCMGFIVLFIYFIWIYQSLWILRQWDFWNRKSLAFNISIKKNWKSIGKHSYQLHQYHRGSFSRGRNCLEKNCLQEELSEKNCTDPGETSENQPYTIGRNKYCPIYPTLFDSKRTTTPSKIHPVYNFHFHACLFGGLTWGFPLFMSIYTVPQLRFTEDTALSILVLALDPWGRWLFTLEKYLKIHELVWFLHYFRPFLK